MYFVRTFKAGGDHDPRQKIWAEFECTCCREKNHIDVTTMMHTFDFKRERVCPKCKKTSPEDYKKNLQKEIERLTETKQNIDIQIEEMISKLNSLENKKA